jgi:cytochrome c oxidase assembly protein subunit 15
MSDTYGLPSWFPKAYRILVIEVAFLLVIGASVRVFNSGLACPDWPLCFNAYVPDFHPQVYLEFIHRVLAGVVGIATLLLNVILLSRPRVPVALKYFAAFAVVLILSQVALGGLTVLLQLKSVIVAAHLAIGTAFFAILLWITLELKRVQAKVKFDVVEAPIRGWTALILTAVYGQVLLGALVASNYAGLACSDFPKCQGVWIPTLEGPIGLQVIHRLGAYAIAVLVIANVFVLSKSSPFLRKQSKILLIVVIAQIALGIANVLFSTPPLLAILHLAIAVKLLYVAVRQFHYATVATIATSGSVVIDPNGNAVFS